MVGLGGVVRATCSCVVVACSFCCCFESDVVPCRVMVYSRIASFPCFCAMAMIAVRKCSCSLVDLRRVYVYVMSLCVVVGWCRACDVLVCVVVACPPCVLL